MGKGKSDEQIAIELAFEAQSFSKQITSINKEIKNVENNFKSAGKGVDDFENSFQGLDGKIQKTSKQIDLYNKKLEKQKEEYDDLKGTVDKQISKLNELEKTQGKGSAEWKKQADLVQKNSTKLNKLGTDMNSTKSSISSLSKELESSKKDFDDLGKKTKSLDENLEDVSKQAKLSESEFNKLGSELQESGTYFQKLSNDINKISSEINTSVKKVNLYENEIKTLSGTLEKNKKEHTDLGSKITEYQKQLDRCADVYGENSKEADKYKQKLLQLKDQYVKLENEIEENTDALDTYQTELNNTQVELNQLDRELRSMPFDKFGSDLQASGQKLKSVGSSLTTNVTLPITAALGAAGKFAMDFEEGMAKVGTVADVTKVPIKQLKEEIIDLSNKTGQSTGDLNEALYQAISASVDTADSVDFLDVSVKAAVGGFSDTTTAVNGLSTVLNSYGMESKDAEKIANQMLITQNAGKTSFDELASSIGKVTPLSSALGLKTEELFSSLAVTTAQGLATSESISALKASMANIIKPSKDASEAAQTLGIDFSVSALQSKGWIGFLSDLNNGLKKASPEFDSISSKFGENAMKLLDMEKAGQKSSTAYKELTKENKNLSKELELLSQAADSPVGAMATMFGSVEGLNAMLMLTSEQGMSKYNDTMKEMETNTGALDKAYGEMSDTTSFKFKKALNESKNAVMELGVKLLPVINQALELFGKLIDKLNSLSPAQQENIIKIGLMAAVIGPLLTVVGSLTSGIGGLVKMGGSAIGFFSKFGTSAAVATKAVSTVGTSAAVAGGAGGLGALTAGLGGVVMAAAPYVLAGAAVAGAGYAVYKALDKEVIPSVNLFADSLVNTGAVMTEYGAVVQTETVKISEATQEAVGSYLSMSEGVTESLTNMYLTSEVITDENCNSLITKYSEMGATITTGIEADKTADLNTLTNFFGASTMLTEEQEAEMLRLTQEGYDGKKNTIAEIQGQITEILVAAKNAGRELQEEEVLEIGKLQDSMRTHAITTLSEQASEAQVILDRMSAYDARVTAEQAGTHISTLNGQRDKAVDAANSEYRQTVATFETMRDELRVISAEQANELIADAEKQRDDTIKAAKETRDGAVDKIFGMNKELIKDVDSSTGEIVGFWDKLFGKWDKWKPGKKTMSVETAYTTSGSPQPQVGKSVSAYNVDSMVQYASKGASAVKSYSFSKESPNISTAIDDNSMNIPLSKYKTTGGYFNAGTIESRSISLNTKEDKVDNIKQKDLNMDLREQNNILKDMLAAVISIKESKGGKYSMRDIARELAPYSDEILAYDRR